MRKRKKYDYLVCKNLVPLFRGSKVECEKFLKALKKENRANPYYVPNWDNYYCGKLCKFSVGFNS